MHAHPRETPLALRLGAITMVAAVVTLALFAGLRPAPVYALGGPIILGGDDLTDHGSVDGSGNNQNGWLYLQRALENVSPQVTRTNDGSVAALGSVASSSTSGDAGAAIGSAAAKAGLTVTYYDGATAINGFFTSLAGGTTTPRIIWIAGTGAGNDLDSAEITAIDNNATGIADFVNSGGGLISHGVAYGWLQTLLPGLLNVNSGSSDDLTLTAAGVAAFPGVSNENINAGPWHNHFEGNFGGLQVLATSGDVNDSGGNDAAVILGGAAVQLPGTISLEPATATNPTQTSHTVTATVLTGAGQLRAGAVVTFTVTAGPNAGDTGTGTTDQAGKATFTYTGDGGAGTDTIQASVTDELGAVRSATATKTWEAPPDPSPSPSPSPQESVFASTPTAAALPDTATGPDAREPANPAVLVAILFAAVAAMGARAHRARRQKVRHR